MGAEAALSMATRRLRLRKRQRADRLRDPPVLRSKPSRVRSAHQTGRLGPELLLQVLDLVLEL